MRDVSLSGKVAVVTGGVGGIGRAISRGLVAEGASVVVLDRQVAQTLEGLTGLVVDDQFWYRAAASLAVGSGTLGIELQGHTQYNSFFTATSTSPLEALLVGTARISAHTTLRGGIGTGVVGGVGAPALRLALGDWGRRT